MGRYQFLRLKRPLVYGVIAGVLLACTASFLPLFKGFVVAHVGTQPWLEDFFNENDTARRIAKSLALAVLFLFSAGPLIYRRLGPWFKGLLAAILVAALVSGSQSALVCLGCATVIFELAKRYPLFFGSFASFRVCFGFSAGYSVSKTEFSPSSQREVIARCCVGAGLHRSENASLLLFCQWLFGAAMVRPWLQYRAFVSAYTIARVFK